MGAFVRGSFAAKTVLHVIAHKGQDQSSDLCPNSEPECLVFVSKAGGRIVARNFFAQNTNVGAGMRARWQQSHRWHSRC